MLPAVHATPFRTYALIRWCLLIVVGTILLILLARISLSLALVFAVVLLLVAVLEFWALRRVQYTLARHGGHIPWPGAMGYFGFDVRDGNTVDVRPSTQNEPPPTCACCGKPSKVGDLHCSNCGTWLWSETNR